MIFYGIFLPASDLKKSAGKNAQIIWLLPSQKSNFIEDNFLWGKKKKDGFSVLNLVGSKHHTAALSLPLLWDKGEKEKDKSEKIHKDSLIGEAKAAHASKANEGN